MSKVEAKALSFREKLSFGLGDISHGLSVSSITVWFLYYLTDVAGLSPFLAGLAVTIGRLWDAVTDPVMGWVTDNTTSRWGKRLPYLLFGAVPYAGAYFALWAVPAFESEIHMFIYVTLSLLLFNTCLTVVFVPYTSLTAALTVDYDERTSLTGFRMVSSQVAFLVGAVVPVSITTYLIANAPEGSWRIDYFGSWAGTAREGYLVMGGIFSVIMILSIWTTFFGCSERKDIQTGKSEFGGPLNYALLVFDQLKKNRPYLIAVSLLLLCNSAATMAASNLPYYLQYILGMESERQKILGILFLSAIISVSVWVFIAKKIGKVETLRIALVLYITLLLILPFLDIDSGRILPLLSVAIGICHAACLTIPWAIIPDVVEYDQLDSGKRREGLFYGGTTFSYKAATGVAFLIGSSVLQLSGYEAGVEQGKAADLAIRLLVGLVPAFFLFLAFFLTFKYSLNREKYDEIRQKLSLS
ncbi:MAG TPA: glycoside-pentoside-hexuronide (GPH):cation symporter [Oligoflexia bacterium]|mgnify:CR=1 FL=1|nr:glycoside-pentoside-hexuronide (GPH):cation symporter [Oligoflexia bacterium]HMP48089.1 glycoside-pentoside-hexuronide (GPH):cation symporter [Oligoflexia bacterium]